MRLRALAVYPLLYAVALLGLAAIALRLGDGGLHRALIADQRLLVRFLAAAGCFAAVSGFAAGDHLRRAWLGLGLSTGLLLLRDVLGLFPAFQPAGASPGAQVVSSGLVIVSNVCFLTGIVLLARSWRMAAIALPGGRAGAAAVTLVTVALALAVAGPGALDLARAVYGGDWSSLIYLVSTVVDVLSLSLIAPLLLTAISLRGGLFVWPWALATASQVSWLLTDATASLGAGPAGVPLMELGRSLGGNYLFAAGLAQLLVVRQVRRAGRL
jgi:hypothetical protein